MPTFIEALEKAGWLFEDNGWVNPKTGDWYEYDREACAAMERGNSLAYDSNYPDEWE